MNENKPLVSVLIPAYNHEKYVEAAILSVVNQTYGYKNIQLIVTDDYSRDRTPIILKELAGKFGFTLILHEQNIGLCATMNEMISLSKGEFIASFASDDISIQDRIEKQINILSQYPDIDILTGEAILIDENGEIISDNLQNPDESLTSYNFDDIFLLNWPGFSAGTAIIKRNLFTRIGAYDQNFKAEDYYFWLKAAYNKARIVKCNKPFLFYRIHRESFSSNDNIIIHEVSKILAIYKDHPKYSKALHNREIYNMSKWVFRSKNSVILHLIKNPALVFNKRIIKVLIMLILPTFVLKRKYPENYYRYVVR
jgi:alpha-1,3-rhamnosyltransferase